MPKSAEKTEKKSSEKRNSSSTTVKNPRVRKTIIVDAFEQKLIKTLKRLKVVDAKAASLLLGELFVEAYQLGFKTGSKLENLKHEQDAKIKVSPTKRATTKN